MKIKTQLLLIMTNCVIILAALAFMVLYSGTLYWYVKTGVPLAIVVASLGSTIAAGSSSAEVADGSKKAAVFCATVATVLLVGTILLSL